MKVFKAALLFVLSTLIFFFSPSRQISYAESDGTYAYAGENACFCKSPDSDSVIFIVPESYCVKIISESGDWYRCVYGEDDEPYAPVEGYVLKTEVTLLDSAPATTYLRHTVEIEFYAEQANPNFPPLSKTCTVAYYGKYPAGDSVSYVRCDGKFGYVKAAVDYFPPNELPLPTASVSEPSPKDDGAVMLTVALVITGVAAAAIVILYFTGKKPKLPRGKD